MQGTCVWSLVQDDPYASEQLTKHKGHDYWATFCDFWNPSGQNRGLQEGPVQWEARAHDQEQPPPTTREKPGTAMKTRSSQKIDVKKGIKQSFILHISNKEFEISIMSPFTITSKI